MPRTRTLVATVALASAHMPGEYHPPGEHGQLERFIEWLPWSSLGRMPPTDGARWYADPQTVSNLFLAIIAVLMIFQHVDFFLHFRERRFGSLVRESPLHLRRRSRALVRGLRRRLPRRQPRQPIVFSRARATLEAKLSTMVGLDEVKAHLSNMLDTLEMDARRCAQMPGFVTQRGCMHMVFLGNPGTGKTAVAELVAVLLKEMGLLRRGHLVLWRRQRPNPNPNPSPNPHPDPNPSPDPKPDPDPNPDPNPDPDPNPNPNPHPHPHPHPHPVPFGSARV